MDWSYTHYLWKSRKNSLDSLTRKMKSQHRELLTSWHDEVHDPIVTPLHSPLLHNLHQRINSLHVRSDCSHPLLLPHDLHLKYDWIITTTTDAWRMVDVVLDKTIRKVSETSTQHVCVATTQIPSTAMPSVTPASLLSRNLTWEILMTTFPFVIHIGPN